ncbi:hypothetical protein KKA87_15005 [bacterium]|nr:hypothetical protein [bacterium]MBU1875165.1 hypothetical protein [bacterium]
MKYVILLFIVICLFITCDLPTEQKDQPFTVFNDSSVSISVSNVGNSGTIAPGKTRECTIPAGYSHGSMVVKNLSNEWSMLNINVEPDDYIRIFGNETALGFEINP